MSFNRKTTSYTQPSVKEMLRAALTEDEVDDAIAFARLTYHGASADTKRKWERQGELVKQKIRRAALQVIAF